MDVSRVSSKGQVTIPIEIRKKLGIKEGDKIVFMEKDNNIILINSNQLVYEEFQKEMAGEAEKAGIKSEQDVVEMVREVRGKLWKKNHDRNA
jgi:AbrB family looped-hinge helix DNA binding protein